MWPIIVLLIPGAQLLPMMCPALAGQRARPWFVDCSRVFEVPQNYSEIVSGHSVAGDFAPPHPGQYQITAATPNQSILVVGAGAAASSSTEPPPPAAGSNSQHGNGSVPQEGSDAEDEEFCVDCSDVAGDFAETDPDECGAVVNAYASSGSPTRVRVAGEELE